VADGIRWVGLACTLASRRLRCSIRNGRGEHEADDGQAQVPTRHRHALSDRTVRRGWRVGSLRAPRQPLGVPRDRAQREHHRPAAPPRSDHKGRVNTRPPQTQRSRRGHNRTRARRLLLEDRPDRPTNTTRGGGRGGPSLPASRTTNAPRRDYEQPHQAALELRHRTVRRNQGLGPPAPAHQADRTSRHPRTPRPPRHPPPHNNPHTPATPTIKPTPLNDTSPSICVASR
jgi:hypothetical protein